MAMIDPGSGWAVGWVAGKSANWKIGLKVPGSYQGELGQSWPGLSAADRAPRPGLSVHELPLAEAASDRGQGRGLLL